MKLVGHHEEVPGADRNATHKKDHGALDLRQALDLELDSCGKRSALHDAGDWAADESIRLAEGFFLFLNLAEVGDWFHVLFAALVLWLMLG